MRLPPLHAGFLRRCAALICDGVLLLILWVCFFTAVTFIPTLWFMPVFLVPVFLVLAALYSPLFHASKRQASPGKVAFGIKVTDLAGQRIGIGRAFTRHLATLLTLATLGLGLLVCAWTAKRQSLHDAFAGTLVVDAKATPEQVAAGGSTMPATRGVWIVDILAVLSVVLAVSIVIPIYEAARLRGPLNALIGGARDVMEEVQAALLANRAPPQRPAKLPPHAKSVTIKPDGAFEIETDPALIEGGRYLFTPSRRPDGHIEWRCETHGIPLNAVPATCRH